MLQTQQIIKFAKTLTEGQKIKFKYNDTLYNLVQYGKGQPAVEEVCDLKCGRLMNVSKITDNYIYLYCFDMLGNETKGRIPVKQIEVLKIDLSKKERIYNV